MTKKKTNENQITALVTDSNEMVLLESRTMRDQNVYRDDVLEKVKAISLLGKKFEATIQMAAKYYDVPFETIKSVIKRNKAKNPSKLFLHIKKGPAHDEMTVI